MTAKLQRKMGLLTLAATGICSMFGASINVVPFMIQRNVPGIGPYVIYAFGFAAIPALLAAFAYSMLGSAMPRAGGSYLYASRGLHPYLGFVASFSQWFGLSIVIGVIAYIIVPFIRDIFLAVGMENVAETLAIAWVRVPLALLLIWVFVIVNINGAKMYSNTLLPMMFLMFGLGAIVIVAGFYFSQTDFVQALEEKDGRSLVVQETIDFDWKTFLSAAALLFSSFIGFDSIAQAGSEAKNPDRNIPAAILLAIATVGIFYFVFTLAVYHTVPWSFVASEALQKDISAPGLLSYVLNPFTGALILTGAAIALINDLPAMLLSVSRLMFAWAEDRIFPRKLANVHPQKHTPVNALVLAGIMASVGVLGSHFAGDFFLGIDIMVTSMMVNFLLMCITVLTITKVNPKLAADMSIFNAPMKRKLIGGLGSLLLVAFLIVHVYKDLSAKVENWYFHSTYVWLIVMSIASLIFLYKWNQLKNNDISALNKFKKLPQE